MPAQAVPVIVAVLAFFAVFIVAVGGVSIWCNLDDR